MYCNAGNVIFGASHQGFSNNELHIVVGPTFLVNQSYEFLRSHLPYFITQRIPDSIWSNDQISVRSFDLVSWDWRIRNDARLEEDMVSEGTRNCKWATHSSSHYHSSCLRDSLQLFSLTRSVICWKTDGPGLPMFQNSAAIPHIGGIDHCISILLDNETHDGRCACSLRIDKSEFVIDLNSRSLTFTNAVSNDLNKSFEPFLISFAIS